MNSKPRFSGKVRSRFGHALHNSEERDPRGLKPVLSRSRRPTASRRPSMPEPRVPPAYEEGE